MPGEAFAVGERVSLTQPHFGFPAGSTGTIVYQYAGVTDVCRVRLDADGLVHPVPCAILAPMIPAEKVRVVGAPLS
jgi:hypothetical protein